LDAERQAQRPAPWRGVRHIYTGQVAHVSPWVRKGLKDVLWMARGADIVEDVDQGILIVWLE
jgi:hypothetical protein